MAASPWGSARPRPRLGAPVLPIAATPTYLRHRVAAERGFRDRRRTILHRRLLLVFVAGLFHFLIGRDLVGLARARARLASTEVRGEAHALTADLRNLIQISRMRVDETALFPSEGEAADESPPAEVLGEPWYTERTLRRTWAPGDQH